MACSDTGPTGLDVVLQSRSGNVAKLLGVIHRLEPAWNDEDVWALLGCRNSCAACGGCRPLSLPMKSYIP